MSSLERAVDLGFLFEHERFLDAFCGGCPCAPERYFDECQAMNDPACPTCARHKLFERIEKVIDKAEEEIVDDMREEGCVA